MAEKIGVYFDASSIADFFDIDVLAQGVQQKWDTLSFIFTRDFKGL